MYIERFIEKKIRKYLDKREIIAVVGPRQCGKTTTLKYIYNDLPNAKFISFDDMEILELFSNDTKAFAELYVKDIDYLFIDEFQYAKDGGKKLKYIYDNFETKILISGSSATDLSVQSIKYLVGRIFVFNMYPFSFGEFLKHKDGKLYNIWLEGKLSSSIIEKINSYYKDFAVFGGYPRVVISKNNEEKKEVLKNIYNTYFLKEIKEILQLQDDFKLSKLVKILAIQTGGITNYNELSASTGFSHNDLLKNLNILQKTFICIESRPHFTNKKKEIVKAPKIFFLDNGFRNIILKDFREMYSRDDNGAINENFVASEIVKSDIEPKYWRTKAKAEVDFIIEKNGEIIPIEVKSNLRLAKIPPSFRNFLSEYNPKKGFILSSDFFERKRIGNIKIFFRPLFDIQKIIK